jgi:hypothetical protein
MKGCGVVETPRIREIKPGGDVRSRPGAACVRQKRPPVRGGRVLCSSHECPAQRAVTGSGGTERGSVTAPTASGNHRSLLGWHGSSERVARQALTASRAQLEPLTRILAAALAPCFVNIAAHRRAFSSTRRPAAVIRTLATSILREPATTRSAVAVARPASTSSIMSLIANPCACRMPSGQPLSQDASNSSARMRSGLMSRLWRRVGIVRCLPGSHRLTGYRDTLFQCMEPNLAMALAPACVSVGPLSLTMIRAAPTYQRPHETVGRDQATPFSI